MSQPYKLQDWEAQVAAWIVRMVIGDSEKDQRYFNESILNTRSLETTIKAALERKKTHVFGVRLEGLHTILDLYPYSGNSVLAVHFAVKKSLQINRSARLMKHILSAMFQQTTRPPALEQDVILTFGDWWSGSNLLSFTAPQTPPVDMEQVYSEWYRFLRRTFLMKSGDVVVALLEFTTIDFEQTQKTLEAIWESPRDTIEEDAVALSQTVDYMNDRLQLLSHRFPQNFKRLHNLVKAGKIRAEDVMPAVMRLRLVITEPDDIYSVIECGYYSAADIGNQHQKLAEVMKEKGIPQERISLIIRHSRLIMAYHEGVRLKAVKTRDNNELAVTKPEPKSVREPPDAPEINMTAMFGMQGMGCEECCSITGAAAYFVDLLRSLERIQLPNSKFNLMEQLFKRRPDLGELQLSCANIKVLIPYLDLVNEVLEAVVDHLVIRKMSPDRLQLPAFNMDKDDAVNSHLAQPQHTNTRVYEDIARNAVFPMHVFPYNDATHSMRTYLSTLGSTRLEFITALRPTDIDQKGEVDPDVKEAISRACAAETLGLQYEEYVAITKEGFYPRQGHQAKTSQNKDYETAIGLKGKASYWGYDNETTMVGESGLANMKDQFLPRSGLAFEDLLRLAETSYVEGELRIESSDKSGIFTGDISKMVLRSGEAKDQSTEKKVETYDRVQRFLRLRTRLQWSIEDLDAVVTTLLDRCSRKHLSPKILDELAAVKELSELTKLSPKQLQPFWGDMNTRGKDSLYREVFLDNSVTSTVREAFGYDLDPSLGLYDFRLSRATVAGHSNTIASVLGVTVVELEAICSAEKPQPHNLSISLISQFYRVCTLCKTLGISPLLFGKFPVYPEHEGQGCFNSARTTLKIVKNHLTLQTCNAPWTAEEILFVCGKETPVMDQTLHFKTKKCLETVHSIRVALAKSGETKVATVRGTILSVQVERLGVQLVGAENAKKLAKALLASGGTKPSSADSGQTSNGHTAPGSLSTEARNILSPVLSSDMVNEIASAANLTERQQKFIDVATVLVSRQYQVQTILAVLRKEFPDLNLAVLQFLITNMEIAPGETALKGLLSLRSEESCSESNGWKGYFRPPSTGDYSLRKPVNNSDTLYLDEEQVIFETESGPEKLEATTKLEGTRWCRLQCDKRLSDFTWEAQSAVGVSPAPFCGDLCVNDAAKDKVGVIMDQLMRMEMLIKRFHLPLAEILFWHRIGEFDIEHCSLEQIHKMHRFTFLRDAFEKNGGRKSLISLYMWLHSGEVGLSSDQLAEVTAWSSQDCAQFIASKYPVHTDKGLAALFKDTSVLYEMYLAMRLVKKLNLQAVSFQRLFRHTDPQIRPNYEIDFQIADSVRLAVQKRFSATANQDNTSLFSTANDTIRVGRRIALTHYFLQQDYAVDHQLRETDQLFGHFLIDVQMGPTLRTSRIKQAISTVQLFIRRCMLGAEVDNGIPSETLQNKDTKPTDWESLLRYRIWEATQKSRLYPENWIDPTLRDTKSDQFKALEASLTQTSLDWDSINALIRTYIQGIDQVADLQIEAYFWHRTPKVEDDFVNSTFYLFGRTRTAPFIFYYRTMRLSWQGELTEPYWMPWSKIDVDITVITDSGDGKTLHEPGSYLIPVVHNSRLILCLPEITAKQEQPNRPAEIKINAANVSVDKPNPFWEIRMGYTELKNGQWSPKQTSQSWIKLKKNDHTLAPIGNFQFTLKKPAEALTIVVSHAAERDSVWLGNFEMRQHQIVLTDDERSPKAFLDGSKDKHVKTIVARFSKVSKTKNALLGLGDNFWHLRFKQLLYKPKSWSASDTHTWVMSFDELDNKPAPGFVVEYSGKTNETHNYFGFPSKQTMSLNNYLWRKASKRRSEFGLEDEEAKKLNRVQNLLVNHEIAWAEVIPAGWYTEWCTEYFRSQRLSSSLWPGLMQRMSESEDLDPIYELLSSKKDEDILGKRESGSFHECASPSAIYTWELAVHIPCLLMERLIATQQYEQAVKIGQLVFNPRKNGTSVSRCWSFPPFRDENVRAPLKNNSQDAQALEDEEWNLSCHNVHAAARNMPVDYMKRIAVKYIEALNMMGDSFFRRNTLESIPFAIEMYTEASHIFGPPPVEIPPLGKRTTKTYNQIRGSLGAGPPNVDVDLELNFPFYVDQDQRGTDEPGTLSLPSIRAGYFCTLPNPQMNKLRSLIDDRLSKIRNGLDINGNKQVLPLFEPPIDPGVIARANAGVGGGVAGLLAGMESPMPSYRFHYLLQRAFELVNELKSFGQQLLSIKERKDAESLSMLRSQHQKALLDCMKSVKQHAKKEIATSRKVLEESRKQQESRLQHLLALTGDDDKMPHDVWKDFDPPTSNTTKDPLCPSNEEAIELSKADEGATMNERAVMSKAVIQMLMLLPDPTTMIEPWGIGMQLTLPGGRKLGEAAMAAAGIAEARAQMFLDESSQAARRAALQRQLQSRRMEANAAGGEWMVIKRRLEELDDRDATCDAEIKAQEQEIKNAAAEEEWLKTKYTSEKLYALLDNSLSTLFHQTYLLGNEMSRLARRALDFEHAMQFPNSTSYSADIHPGMAGYWEETRDGQLAAEAMFLDLKRLEMMNMENRTHDYEITKAISLRQLDPERLFELRSEGSTDFSLPETLFDMDFPGQYCRRISSVALSIPCILGAYTSPNCTLTLIEHRYRISPIVGKGYDNTDESTFRTDHIPIVSIAVSNGLQDGGVFNLDFQTGERYGPFEGAGAISKWRLKLPEVRQFDYDTITDAILHVRYTARSGGDELLKPALANVEEKWKSKTIKDLPVMAIDLKAEYPTQWRKLVGNVTGTEAPSATLTLPGLKDKLPYWASQKQTQKAKQITLLISSKDMEISTSIARLRVNDAADTLERAEGGSGKYKKLTWGGLALNASLSDELTMQFFNSEKKPLWDVADKSGTQIWLLISYSVGS